MTVPLTTYLFRTFGCKPKGLKVSLRICTVNSWVETFNEQENPVATLMNHGLFLARPTKHGVRDPSLVGILNQGILHDYEPPAHLEVLWTARKKEDPTDQSEWVADEPNLGKRSSSTKQDFCGRLAISHQITLSKHGISKVMPHSSLFDQQVARFFDENISRYRSLEFNCRSVANLPTSIFEFNPDEIEEPMWKPDIPDNSSGKSHLHIFVSFIQRLLNLHKNMISPECDISAIIPETAKDKYPKRGRHVKNEEFRQVFRKIGSMGNILSSMCSTLAYFRSFKRPKHFFDLETYEDLVNKAQKVLFEVSSAVLNLFILPFLETLGESSNEPDTSCQLSATYKLQRAKSLLERLIKLATTPLTKITDWDMVEGELPDSSSFSKCNFWEVLHEYLIKPKFSVPFFSKVERLLEAYPAESRKVAEAVSSLANEIPASPGTPQLFLEMGITDNSRRVSDTYLTAIGNFRLCTIRSARTTKTEYPIRFCLGLETRREWRMLATLSIRETVVCIMIEEIFDHYKTNLTDEDYEKRWLNTIHAQVFRQGTLVASFIIEPNKVMDIDRCEVTSIQYFTGRHFLMFKNYLRDRKSPMAVLDMALCVERVPQAPIFHQSMLEDFITKAEGEHYIHSCTDRFLAVMKTREEVKDLNGLTFHKPVSLQLISFDTLDGFRNIATIHCADCFEQITKKVKEATVYQNATANGQLSWRKDHSSFYYTHWKFKDFDEKHMNLFLAYFVVSSDLRSMKAITYSRFPLNHLLEDLDGFELVYRPKFSMLRTKLKEYLVMDIKESLEWDYNVATQRPTIFQRLLFTLHKNKIHWIPVNKQLIYLFPQHIGTQMQNPGYSTFHLPLFHQRRIFCADKVASAVYRLDYKPG